MKTSPIIVALDFDAEAQAEKLISQLDPSLCALKVGKAMFTRLGPRWVKKLIDKNYAVFLDLKYHDIPIQVAKACVAAAEMGVWMLTLHTLGGAAMMKAAQLAVKDMNLAQKPLLLGVTLLTSLREQDLTEIGIIGPLAERVSTLAKMAKQCGLDGLVCSAQEATTLKQQLGKDFCLVTPGIRMQVVQGDDQERTLTPTAAIQAGAHYLVIGRPITQAEKPRAVIEKILLDIEALPR